MITFFSLILNGNYGFFGIYVLLFFSQNSWILGKFFEGILIDNFNIVLILYFIFSELLIFSLGFFYGKLNKSIINNKITIPYLIIFKIIPLISIISTFIYGTQNNNFFKSFLNIIISNIIGIIIYFITINYSEIFLNKITEM